jgi:hypothetical protein
MPRGQTPYGILLPRATCSGAHTYELLKCAKSAWVRHPCRTNQSDSNSRWTASRNVVETTTMTIRAGLRGSACRRTQVRFLSVRRSPPQPSPNARCYPASVSTTDVGNGNQLCAVGGAHRCIWQDAVTCVGEIDRRVQTIRDSCTLSPPATRRDATCEPAPVTSTNGTRLSDCLKIS